VFERFSDPARRAVVFAQEEARLLEHNYIGTEHILLGLLNVPDGVAARTLQSLGIALESVRGEVEKIIGRGGGTPSAHVLFTARAKKVLELSLRESIQFRHNHIGTEHILLGLIREGDGVAAEVLRTLGVDLSRVREHVVQVLSESEPEPVTEGEAKPGPEGVAFVRAASGSVTLGVTPDPQSPPPRCARCGASLTTGTAYRVVEATGDETEAEPVRVVIVYCLTCGTALGTAS
jgi:ATP-dependent Clp protease ATP-binding subunit ClpC